MAALIMQNKSAEGGDRFTSSAVLSTLSDDPRPSSPWSLPLVTAVNSPFSIKVQGATAKEIPKQTRNHELCKNPFTKKSLRALGLL